MQMFWSIVGVGGGQRSMVDVCMAFAKNYHFVCSFEVFVVLLGQHGRVLC